MFIFFDYKKLILFHGYQQLSRNTNQITMSIPNTPDSLTTKPQLDQNFDDDKSKYILEYETDLWFRMLALVDDRAKKASLRHHMSLVASHFITDNIKKLLDFNYYVDFDISLINKYVNDVKQVKIHHFKNIIVILLRSLLNESGDSYLPIKELIESLFLACDNCEWRHGFGGSNADENKVSVIGLLFLRVCDMIMLIQPPLHNSLIGSHIIFMHDGKDKTRGEFRFKLQTSSSSNDIAIDCSFSVFP